MTVFYKNDLHSERDNNTYSMDFTRFPPVVFCHLNVCAAASDVNVTSTPNWSNEMCNVLLPIHRLVPKTIEIQRWFTHILLNGRNCNAQYGGIVPPSK